jgi:salicylate hydroxylase
MLQGFSARDLLRAAPDWRKWPLFDCNPIASWTAGRVALMGDAAHPMLPFLTQGAAQAIEDAGALGEVLTRVWQRLRKREIWGAADS